ncbi:hypothetical protein BOX15_Mlig007461g1 [Macrostomum lignano]|uniref:Uncharacterized protein n=1 Tax=Macrostomum lignano TaxID=282301 RepID=A0A267E9Z3_9PLAT|nr:hypothetical protein BOX15_Mlig007461g1 [Macrostomum lignano]
MRDSALFLFVKIKNGVIEDIDKESMSYPHSLATGDFGPVKEPGNDVEQFDGRIEVAAFVFTCLVMALVFGLVYWNRARQTARTTLPIGL